MNRERYAEELDQIIKEKRIRTVFQPIVSLRDGKVLGHEALSRVMGGVSIRNPETLFQTAISNHRLWELEQLCRTTALESASQFLKKAPDSKLFLNVNPGTMHDEKFKAGFTKAFLKEYEIKPENLIFEITERNVITDIKGFQESVSHYKNQEYQIAIDDAGAGYSGLNLISDINPNFIKLDQNLIRNIHSDKLKYALVKGMAELSRASKINLIAEGIENEEEMNALISLGVQYGQGFYIQKPCERMGELRDCVIEKIKDKNSQRNHLSHRNASNLYIRNLCTATMIVAPPIHAGEVYTVFKEDLECFGVCVVSDQVPVGIVTREKLALRLSGQYGFTLNQNKKIEDLMDRNFLSVEGVTPLTEVATQAMSRTGDRLYDFIVVTEGGRYSGSVTIRDLLQKTIEIEVSEAKHQNPLTGLPGNLLIEKELLHCLNEKNHYTVAYIDIDHFKAYNDVYGFENGDKVITMLAELLQHQAARNCFVGHIGGDDFVLIAKETLADQYFRSIESLFQKEVRRFYRSADLERGSIRAKNRKGKLENYPLMTITIVHLNQEEHMETEVCELSALLATRKVEAKNRKKKFPEDPAC